MSETFPKLLSAEAISVTISDNEILKEISLEAYAGEVLALVGPNGAGKSTLLGVLAGDLEPTRGRVLLRGQELGKLKAKEASRERAVMLQEQQVAFGFRAQEIVAMGRSPWVRTPEEDLDEQSIADAMERADITGLAQRLYPSLSGGEKARTTFAKTLAQDTGVLLLDEPTAALDIRHQEQLFATVRDQASSGRLVVVVVHDLTLAAAWADRICVLDRGEIAAIGTPREVLTEALLGAVYEHPVKVIDHDGDLIVVPGRNKAASPTSVSQQEAACLGS
ncbi:MAG: heme ABC transporter ATP-binding protein [Marmoricola sp.]